jgi:hypothetical protein
VLIGKLGLLRWIQPHMAAHGKRLAKCKKSPGIPPGLNLIGLVGVGKINARGNRPSTLATMACSRHNHAANYGANAVSKVS